MHMTIRAIGYGCWYIHFSLTFPSYSSTVCVLVIAFGKRFTIYFLWFTNQYTNIYIYCSSENSLAWHRILRWARYSVNKYYIVQYNTHNLVNAIYYMLIALLVQKRILWIDIWNIHVFYTHLCNTQVQSNVVAAIDFNKNLFSLFMMKIRYFFFSILHFALVICLSKHFYKID